MSNEVIAKHHQSTNSTRLRNQLLVLSFALLIITQSVGCASQTSLGIGEAVAIAYRDNVWAKRAFNLRYGNCDRQYADHFQSGFRAGYTETSNGGDGFTPALPPASYRGVQFQSADGSQCINSWFEGYPAGVAAAKQDKVGNYHDVMISRLIDTATKQAKAESVLPSDVPIVAGKRARSRIPIIKPKRSGMPKFNLPPIISGSQASKVVPANYSTTDNEPLPMAVSPEPWKSN